MKMNITEKGAVEDFIIQELQKLDWKYIKPEEMNKRRNGDFEEPIVKEDLRRAIKRLNSEVEFTDGDIDFVLVSLRNIVPNIEGIEKFLDIMKNGLKIPLQKENKEHVIRPIDFDDDNIEKNDFVVTNQFKLGHIRADIVLLVNGIPLVLIECKNIASEKDWTDTYHDIKIYEEEVSELFKYVQFSIATDGIKTCYFPNCFADEGNDYISTWKDPFPLDRKDFNEDFLKITIYGLFIKRNFLNLIENFIFIKKEEGKQSKVMSRYVQFRASNKIFNRVINTLNGKRDEKFGLIWHWLGAGKTYSMAFSAWKLHRCLEAQNPTIFVVVDRKDLEEQTEKEFASLGVPIERIKSIDGLIEVLRWGKGEGKKGIFITTIEKFRDKEFREAEKKGKVEIDRENVIVLVDESHRTHYGELSIVMRSVLKNAFIFGFTGTPLSKRQRNTFGKFCPPGELYLDRYSMIDAREDGFTLPLSYTDRLPQYHLNQQQLKELSEFEEEEIETLSSEEREAMRRKTRVSKAYAKKPERIKAIAKDIVKHFKDIVEPTGLKAMLVAVDREACVMYKKALDELGLPPEQSEIVMSMSSKEKGKLIREYYQKLQKEYKKDLKSIHREITDKFKEQENPKILVVTHMLLTGFNARNLWAMYLDKSMEDHKILQAIARTNRPYQNKKFGLIVDYIGILENLEKAFKEFEARDIKDLKVVIRKLDEEKKTFKKLLENLLDLFKDVRKEDTRESVKQALEILADLETAKEFETSIKELMKSYEMLSGEPFLRGYLNEYRWLVKIYTVYYKSYKKKNVDELKIERLSHKTYDLIQKTIDIKKIDEEYPTISIDEKYIEMLKKSIPKTPGAAIDALGNVGNEIRNHPDSVFFRKLSDDVERVYEEFRKRKIKTEEAVNKILELSEEIVEWKKEERVIGKNRYPIYEGIKIVLPHIEKKKAIDFIDDLMTDLRQRKLLFEGWQQQRDIRRAIKREIRLLLLSHFRENKNKIDDLMEVIFEALERMKWKE